MAEKIITSNISMKKKRNSKFVALFELIRMLNIIGKALIQKLGGDKNEAVSTSVRYSQTRKEFCLGSRKFLEASRALWREPYMAASTRNFPPAASPAGHAQK